MPYHLALECEHNYHQERRRASEGQPRGGMGETAKWREEGEGEVMSLAAVVVGRGCRL